MAAIRNLPYSVPVFHTLNKRGYNKYLKLEGDVTVTIDMDRFEDINYTEAVDRLIADQPTDEEIKQRLTEIAVQDIEGL